MTPPPRAPTPELASLTEKLAAISGAWESAELAARRGPLAPGAVKAQRDRGCAFTV